MEGLELITRTDGSIVGLFKVNKYLGVKDVEIYKALDKSLDYLRSLPDNESVIDELADIGFVKVEVNEDIEL